MHAQRCSSHACGDVWAVRARRDGGASGCAMMQIAPSTDCMFCMQAGHEKNVQQPPDYPSGPLGLEKSGGLTSILIWTRSRRRCGPRGLGRGVRAMQGTPDALSDVGSANGQTATPETQRIPYVFCLLSTLPSRSGCCRLSFARSMTMGSDEFGREVRCAFPSSHLAWSASDALAR